MSPGRTGFGVAVVTGATLIAGAAQAQSAPAALIACQAETDASARLACYDRELGRLHPQPPPPASPPPASVAPATTAVAPVHATPEVPAPTVPPPPAAVPVPTTPEVPPPTASPPATAAPAAAAVAATAPALSPEQRFGLNGTQLAQKGGPPPPELEGLDAHVVQVTPAPGGGVVLDLDNGQRWQQTSLDQDLNLKPSDAVHIRRATFGSFMLSAGSGRFARVKRLH